METSIACKGIWKADEYDETCLRAILTRSMYEGLSYAKFLAPRRLIREWNAGRKSSDA